MSELKKPSDVGQVSREWILKMMDEADWTQTEKAIVAASQSKYASEGMKQTLASVYLARTITKAV